MTQFLRTKDLAHSFRRLLVAASFIFLLPSCEWDGHFTILGYSTRPNYDPSIRTVYVPIFKNRTFRRGLEFDLTRAVVREIEAKTPYKVVSDCNLADTELSGTIANLTKAVINFNQLNEVREAQTILTVEIIWRNRHTGEILSRPKVKEPLPAALGEMPGPLPPPPPVLVTAVGNFIPELGESITTAQQKDVNQLAVQIVSLMEKPW